MTDSTLPRLIIASHNPGKLREFQAVLGDRWEVSPQTDLGVSEAEETGSTFVENALIKARHACVQGHCAALADDSGLVVPAMGGAPGLRSARYSGGGDEANNALLLQNMATLEGVDRAAFYIAVVVLLRPADDPTPRRGAGRPRRPSLGCSWAEAPPLQSSRPYPPCIPAAEACCPLRAQTPPPPGPAPPPPCNYPVRE